MKKHLLKRVLSMLLVVAMLAGFYVPGAQAASTGLSWKESDQEVRLDLTERKVETHVKESHAPTDMVRVSIVLEEKPTIQAGFPTRNIAANSEAMAYSRRLRDKQEAMAQTISNQVLGGAKLDVVWNLTLVGNIISVNVPYGKLDAIAKVDGVAGVVLENVYEPCVADRGTVAEPQMYASLRMTGSSLVWSTGYTGAGSRVAVIDTGTDTDHQSLDAGAFLYSLEQNAAAAGVSYNSYLAGLDLLDKQEIAAVLYDLNIYEKDSSLTAEKLYLNEKLPFAVNYIDSSNRRLVVDHERDEQGEHGSHVAGIAAANRYIPSGSGYTDALRSVMVAGTAPDAQLITMKVFGYNGGPSDADYLAAVEDAIVLGCDAVNLSLGTGNAGYGTDPYFAGILEYLTTTDTVVVASAGNSYSWQKFTPNGSLYAQDVSMDTVGSPGSYYSFLTVASVENDGGWGPAFQVGDRVVGYAENYYSNSPMIWLDTSYDLSGTAYDYVFIDGLGAPDDYAGINLENKIVFCSRGDSSFSEKANTAVDLGATAVVIYNNEPGTLYMDLSGYYYSNPCVAITQVEADAIRSMSQKKQTSGGLTYYTGTMTVLGDHTGVYLNSEYLTMSDYSSWGVPGDLSLKPEITAPGGYIYSIYGETPYGGGTDQYEIMSGTSMAAPAITGMAALMAQYLRESGIAAREGISVRDLAQSLLMSTATPEIEEASGSYYSILKQGAGLARVDLATSADSYILVNGQSDGKVKAELGDDPNRTGVYTFSFSINNLTDRVLSYNLSADLFRQDSVVYDETESEPLGAGEVNNYTPIGTVIMSTRTASLPGTATFTVNGRSINVQNDLSGYDLNGDGQVNAFDADYLLEYLLGNAATLHGSGDVSGDGQVNTYDAHVLLTKLGGNGCVSVPAGGSVTVNVCLTLSDSAKAELDANFENGTYVEAYVYAESVSTEEGVAGTRHSIPVLAFYGNWSDPNMFDHGSYVELMSGNYAGLTPYMYQEAVSANMLSVSYGNGGEYVFGGNPLDWEENYRPERNAFNSQDGSYLMYQYFTLIRNAVDVQLVISNADTGEVYMQSALGGGLSAYYYVNGRVWDLVQQYAYVGWAGDDAYGQPLPDGTNVEVSLIAVPEYYHNADGTVDYENLGEGVYLTTPFTIDNTDPELRDMAQEDTTLTVKARDNHYVAGAALMSSDGSRMLAYTLADQTNPGTEITVELDLTNVMGDNFQLVVYDYAMNSCTYDVTLDLPEAERPYFTVVDYPNYTYYGLNANGTSMELASASRGMVEAAEYVDGYIFEIIDGGDLNCGYLYRGSDEGMDHFSYLGQLDADDYYEVSNFLDMAYNYDDGQLYALFYAYRNNQNYPYLCTIDVNTGSWNVIGALPVDVDTLAIDGEGNFYSMAYNAPYLYTYTLDDLYDGNMYYVGHTGYYYTGDRSSMAWDHNTDTLYWAYPGALLEVDPNTGSPSVVNYFDYSMTGLYIRPEDGNGYTGLNIAPSGITDPAQWPANTEAGMEAFVESKMPEKAEETTEPTEIPATAPVATGGLNSVVNIIPAGNVDLHSTGEFDDNSGKIVVTLTPADAQVGSTNGRMTVTYDAGQLNLVSVTGSAAAFAYAAGNGTVEVAFASTSEIGGNETVAVLTFEAAEPGNYTFSVLHTENGNGPSGKEEQLTVTSGCAHKYQTVVTAPTCTEDGYTTYTCSECGYSYVDAHVDALGHDYNAVVTAPTCTEDGYTTYTCTLCGDSYMGDEVPALGHDYVDGVCRNCGDGIVSLELVYAPTVNCYAIGDALDLTGIEVVGYLDNGDIIYLTAENLTVLSCDMSTVGTSTAYVGIGNLSVSFPVYVHARRFDATLDPSAYPESDHNYAEGADDWQTVSYPGATSLTLVFSDESRVESYYDFIYVYDGNDNLIASYTGTQAAGVTLTVPGDTVQINLTSDYSICYYGYSFTSITANTVEHTGESVGYQAPTCTEPGHSGAIKCDICGQYVGGERIPALGHNFTAWAYNDDNALMRTCLTCGLEEILEVDRLFTVGGESSNPDLSLEQLRQLYSQVDWSKSASYVTQPSVSAPYVAGRLTDECLDNLVAQVNFFRAIARLDNVGWAENYVTLAQHATVVNAANRQLTHYPSQPADMDDDFYNLGYQGASSSNLAMGYSLMGSVLGYLEDSDSSNIDRVGHRRWVLDPYMAYTGFGYTNAFSAMYAFNGDNTSAEFDYVAFPGGSSVFPNEFFTGYYAWSTHLSWDTFEVPSLDELRVTLTRESDGTQWVFDAETTGTGYYYFHLDTGGYGDAMAIIFRPDGIGTYQGEYTVRITGLWTTEGESAAIEYTVNFQSVESQECDHTPVIRNAVDPTCTENGYTGDTYCSACGELLEEGQIIPATGHHFGAWYETVAPGCKTDGQERRDCADCSHFETRTVDPLGHDYDVVVTEPTCEAGGYTIYTCTRCGYSYASDRTDPLGHDYKAVVTAPTCTEDGYTTYTCDRCGDSYVGDHVDALGHDYKAVVTAPTCTEGGYTIYTCTRCGYSYASDRTDPLGHDYKAVVTAPTCTEGGYTTYTCSACGDSYVGDHVDALGHDYDAVVTEPTCEEGGCTTYTCTNCGDSYVGDYTDALGHNYEDGHCTRCGEAEEYTINWEEAYASLGGNIAVVFKVELSEGLAADPNAFMRFTYAGRTVEIPVSEAKRSGEYYNFYCRIDSVNMTDDITAQMMVGGEVIGRTIVTSLEKYCSHIINTTQDEKTVNLMKAMLNYGAAAQKMLDYKVDNLANKSLSEEDKVFTAVDAQSYKHNVSGAEAGIEPAQALLVLGSETTIRVGFRLTGNKTIDQYTFTVDGEEAVPVYKGGMYVLEVPNIAAHRLDEYHTFTCGGITITYCGLSYTNQVMNKYSEGTTFDMAVALYHYSQATEAYITVKPESDSSKALYAYYAAAEELLG